MSQGREPVVVKRGPGRPPRHTYVAFAFKAGDLVLVKWNDGMVYFAKIKRIDHKRQKCVVVFDDKSQDEAHFSQIHSVDETTTDIICIKCKKDDSDKPNEIVLCDTCGIGFHQKCHIPNIPASALELDTPWNCSYCLKGVKCPYLTESLDVLQNLLSDDEEENLVADEVENTAVLDSDIDSVNEMQQVSPRKKRGRKPAATSLSSEATAAGKREKRKVQASLHTHQSSGVVPLGTSSSKVLSEALKPKTYAHEESDSDAVYLSSGRSTPEPPSHPGTKRKKHHSSPHNQIKKHKRSSVESRTVSVTRVSTPICENGSAEEMDTSRDSSVSDTPQVANHGLTNIQEGSGPDTKRPRTLRVSLSIPDDVEPGTPFDKVVKAHQKIRSPPLRIETKELPSWENFANSNMLNASSPKERPHTLLTEKENDILNPKSKSIFTSESSSIKEAGSSQAVSSQSPSAFLASPLPISSSPKLHSPVKVSVPVTNVKTTSNSPSPAVGTSSPEAAVGYSTPSLHGQSLTSEVAAAMPSSLVVKTSQSEVIKCRPLNQPPLRNPQLHPQPQASVPSQASDSQQTICSGATPGITQASTNLPLSVPTKPTTLPTAAPGASPIGNQQVSHNQQQKQPTSLPLSQVQQPVLMTRSPAAPPVITAPVASVSHNQQQKQPTPLPVCQVQQPVLITQSPAPPPIVTAPSVSHNQQQIQPTSLPVCQVQQAVLMTQSPTAPPVVTAPSKQVMLPKSQITSNISAQQMLASPVTQVRSTIAAHPQAVPQPPTQHVLLAPSRPSSVPTQQQVIVAPPSRPSSVPTQHRLLVTQSQTHHSTVPAQRVLVANSQPSPNACVQQVVVAQQPHCVAKGAPSMVPHTSVALPSPISATSGMPPSRCMTQEHQVRQMVPPRPVQSGGDADVIITGVEPNRITQVPNAVYQKERVTVTTAAVSQQPGERIVFMGNPPTAPGVVYHQPSATAGKKVTVDLQQVVAPVSSNQAGSLVTPIGSHSPVSVVPVVITPTNDLPSTQVLYQVQPPSRGAQPTHIIRETSVPTPPLRSVASTRPTSQVPTSVIVACSPTAASNVAQSSATSVPGAVVYSAIGPNVAAFSSVNTTKPYAIVNAMPGTQIVYTASQGVQPSQVRGTVAAPAGPLPQPPKTYSHVSEKHSVGGKMHHSDVVQTISKKIGDAFDSGNEQLLVAAFEDAWKRFQANGKQYEHGSIKSLPGRESLPPNAEVFSVPGTGSRVNLVRQTSNGSNRLLASKQMTLPHSTVQQVIAPPPLSSQPQTNYIHTPANTAQPPVYLQPVTVSSAAPAGQQHQQLNTRLQSTGLFYPPNSTSGVAAAIQKKATAGTSVQKVIVSQSTPVVRHSVNSGSSERTQESSRKPRSSSSKAKPRLCSRCGKSATYLCSGCHAEWYCGRECQLKAWDTHADTCKA